MAFRRGRRLPTLRAALVAGALVAVLLPACGGGGGSGPDAAVDAYLRAWERGDYAAMASLVRKPPDDFEEQHRDLVDDLRATTALHTRDGAVREEDGRATATIVNRFTSAPWGEWETRGEVALTERNEKWKIDWSTRAFDRELESGRHLTLNVEWPDRAAVLGAGGTPLTVLAAMTRVGIQGSRITDEAALRPALELAGASSTAIDGALATAREHPDWFVDVITIPTPRYTQIRDAIYPVPGTVFLPATARQALTEGLNATLVGRTGPITAELLTQLGPPYRDGDRVGRAGIEASYEKQLAGSPGATVVVEDDAGNELARRAEWPETPGTAVQTTIDPTVQRAAEAALFGVSGEAALVAVRASTGEVLASASLPYGREFDIALRGQYAPGSTFKIVTTADLLEHGFSPSTVLACPATVNVAGQTFRNFEGEAAGSLTLAEAVQHSCNNAFINASADLPAESFPQTATKFGLGVDPKIGVTAFGGSVPTPTGPSEQAATSIGQAKVTASPLGMAMVAASVASGAWHAPRLVAGAPNDSVPPVSLDPGVASALQSMMTSVVTGGTASGAGLPTGTAGKTGTAEFGGGSPPATHAWFVGYRGDVAVAVLVPGGGVGGRVAAPIAARFLNQLPG